LLEGVEDEAGLRSEAVLRGANLFVQFLGLFPQAGLFLVVEEVAGRIDVLGHALDKGRVAAGKRILQAALHDALQNLAGRALLFVVALKLGLVPVKEFAGGRRLFAQNLLGESVLLGIEDGAHVVERHVAGRGQVAHHGLPVDVVVAKETDLGPLGHALLLGDGVEVFRLGEDLVPVILVDIRRVGTGASAGRCPAARIGVCPRLLGFLGLRGGGEGNTHASRNML
jgi:hypothetical protein